MKKTAGFLLCIAGGFAIGYLYGPKAIEYVTTKVKELK